jgi:hypothetical protein
VGVESCASHGTIRLVSRCAVALIGVALAATMVSVGAAAPRVQRVTGIVERVVHAQGPCRGGAAITHEEIAESEAKSQRFPLGKGTFTVFAGDKYVGRPVTRFKTDRSGRFEARLPEGVYCVMAGERKEVAPKNSVGPLQPVDAHLDPGCLRDRALACDATLHVRRNNTRDVKLTLDTFTPCPRQWAQPCWRGPMPP